MLILGILCQHFADSVLPLAISCRRILRSITAQDLQMSGASRASILLPRHNLLLSLSLSLVDIFLHTKMENKHAPRLQLIKRLLIKCLLLRQDAQDSSEFVRPPAFFLPTDTISLYEKKLSQNSKRHSTIRCRSFRALPSFLPLHNLLISP